MHSNVSDTIGTNPVRKNISVKTKEHNLFLLFFQVFIVFFYIYEFNLRAWGLSSDITSRRIVVLVMLIIAIIKTLLQNKKFTFDVYQSGYFKYMKFCVLLLIYVLSITLFIGSGDGDKVAIDLIQVILFSLIPIAFVPYLFDSVDRFLKVILLTAIIQTIIILLCQFNNAFCNFIDINFSTDYEYVSMHRATYAGGIGCITAPGLLRYSTGILACLYYLFKRQEVRYFLLFLLFSFVGTMVARTGLIVMFIGLIFILLFCFKNGKTKLIISLSFLTIFLVGLCLILSNTAAVQNFMGGNFKRLINLFNNGLQSEFLDGYFGDASGNILPPINSKTFFGTGLVNGVSGNGVECIADGGYIRLFFAFGLPGVVLFYGYTMRVLLKGTFQNKKNAPIFWTLLCMITIIIVGEFKEYLILNQYMLFIAFSVILLINKERSMNIDARS